jgi:hypothetical protein
LDLCVFPTVCGTRDPTFSSCYLALFPPDSAPTACSATLRSKVRRSGAGPWRLPDVLVIDTNSFAPSFPSGPADRLLIYLILFISDCINRVAATPGRPSPQYQEALKQLSTLSVDHFSLPGEAGFPLNSLYHGPANKSESGALILWTRPHGQIADCHWAARHWHTRLSTYQTPSVLTSFRSVRNSPSGCATASTLWSPRPNRTVHQHQPVASARGRRNRASGGWRSKRGSE